jgi:hypothetical protein
LQILIKAEKSSPQRFRKGLYKFELCCFQRFIHTDPIASSAISIFSSAILSPEKYKIVFYGVPYAFNSK